MTRSGTFSKSGMFAVILFGVIGQPDNGIARSPPTTGFDVWIWYPAMDPDYSDPKTVEHALAEWAEVFKKLPRIDAVFVPGGDPGHTRPGPFMALLEKQSANLKRFHPSASVWVSAQSFSQNWLDEFLTFLQAEPAWLGGSSMARKRA